MGVRTRRMVKAAKAREKGEIEDVSPFAPSKNTVSTNNENDPRAREFILTGYREKDQSFAYYMSGSVLFGWNNESFDIFSHLFMCMYLLYDLILVNAGQEREYEGRAHFYSDIGEDGNVSSAFLVKTKAEALLELAFVVVFGISAFAHTFHLVSVYYHWTLFQVDWSAIGVAISVVTIAFSSAVVGHHNHIDVSPLLVVALAFMCHNTRSFAMRDKVTKIVGLAFPSLCIGLVNYLPLVLQEVRVDDGAQRRLDVAREVLFPPLLIAGCGLACFVLKIPERFAPGQFDRLGHSHNLHHIWSSVVSVLLLRGLRKVIAAGA